MSDTIASSDTVASNDADLAISDTVGASDASLTPVRAGAPAAAAPGIGQTIGRFVVVDKLGAGGMGVVFAAWDPHLDRKVAIKLLQGQTVDSEEARVRLLREAQAMARIDHPNVLRVHEAGTFGDQVYIAMEFASGGTLKQWLAAKPRTQREIVAVFAQAARGLHAAHAAGLVHRDFKPENVLMFDGDRPRVTDFGLVGVVGDPAPLHVSDRALDASLSENTPLSRDLTRTGALMGTPAYMAPEQFRGELVDATADQFALCVALHAALYGAPPFAGTTFAELSANVIAGNLATPPRDRHVPAHLRRTLLRGLATDPKQRFPSLRELIGELDRDPRRTRFIAAGIAAGMLALGGVGYVALARGAGPGPCSDGLEHASTAWNPSVQQQIAQAFAATHRPDAASALASVTPMFERWRDSWSAAYTEACKDTRVRHTQAEHVLDLRTSCLNSRLDDARAEIAALATGGGSAVDHAPDLAGALPSLGPCSDVAALTDAPPPPANNHAAVAAVRAQLATARAQRMIGHYAQNLALARAALADAKATRYAPVVVEAEVELGIAEQTGVEHKASDMLEQAMRDAFAQGETEVALRAAGQLIHALSDQPAKFQAADAIAGLTSAIAAHAGPPDVRGELAIDLGDLAMGKNKLDDAKQQYQAAYELADQALGSDDFRTMSAVSGLARVAAHQRRYADAQKLFEQVLATARRVAGPDAPSVARALGNLVGVLIAQGQLDKAKQLAQQALDIRLRVFGPDHPQVGSSYMALGAIYSELGDDKAAKEYFLKKLAIDERADGSNALSVASDAENIGTEQSTLGDYTAARASYDRALAIETAAYGSDDPRSVEVLGQLGAIEDHDAHYDAALADYRRAYDVISKAEPGDPRAIDFLGSQVATLTHMGKLADARALEERTKTLMEKAYGPNHPRMGSLLGDYGGLQMKLKDYTGALASFQRAAAIFEARLGKGHPDVGTALRGQGECLIALHREAEAVPLLARAIDIGDTTNAPPEELAEAHYDHAIALAAIPAGRGMARAEAQLALDLYTQAKADKNAKVVAAWLASH